MTTSEGKKAGSGRRAADAALIVELAAGKTLEAAATAVGVSESTICRRLQDTAFRKLVSDARAEMMARAIGRLTDAACRAVETLENLLAAEAEGVRLGAARTILETGNRLRESIEMEARLSVLEERVLNAGGKR